MPGIGTPNLGALPDIVSGDLGLAGITFGSFRAFDICPGLNIIVLTRGATGGGTADFGTVGEGCSGTPDVEFGGLALSEFSLFAKA